MEPYLFKGCLELSPGDLQYNVYLQDVSRKEDGTITGFFLNIKTVELDDPGRDSNQLLEDIRYIESTYGLDYTFSFDY